MKKVAAFILFCGSVNAFAQSTKEIRIDQAGGSMEKMPVLSQLEKDPRAGQGPMAGYDLADCYSYAAIQYWDTYRYMNSTPEEKASFKTSSADYAAILSSSKTQKGKGNFKGGSFADVLAFIGKQGNCSADYVTSQPIFEKAVLFYFSGLAAAINELPLESARAPVVSSPGLEFMESHRIDLVTRVKYENGQILGEYEKAKSILSEELAKLGRPLSNAALETMLMTSVSVDDFVINSLKIDCPKQNVIAAKPVALKEHALGDVVNTYLLLAKDQKLDDETMEKQINDLIGRYMTDFPKELAKHFSDTKEKSLPVPISYCSGLLSEGKDFPGLQLLMNGQNCGPHASVITGVRMDAAGEVKEVLIRNSYGEEACKFFNPVYECAKGSSWVPVKTMQNNLISFGI